MSDEPYRFAINPIVAEGNARRLVDVVAEFFPDGVRSEDLRIRYEQITNLRRASYFDSLAYCKYRGWIVGGGTAGVPLRLNADGSWRPTQTPAEETQDRDRLAHMLDLQTQRNGELQTELTRLRTWSAGSEANGDANVALSALVGIVGDSTAGTRSRLKAAATILGFKVEDPSITAFTRNFLQSVCTGIDVAVEYRVEAAAILRQHESPRVKAETVPANYTENAEPAGPPPIPLPQLLEERRRRCGELTDKIAREYGYVPPPPRRDVDGDSDS